MKHKTNLALITTGVILFLLAVIIIVFMFYIIIFENPNTDISNGFAITSITFSIAIILYVKFTNFGIQKNNIEKTIEEKEKLKELIEIAELSKKLSIEEKEKLKESIEIAELRKKLSSQE